MSSLETFREARRLAREGLELVREAARLPMWRVTAFIGSNIVTSQTIWEGLWMNCVVQSTGQMQCKVYDSLLALPEDLRRARESFERAIEVAEKALELLEIGDPDSDAIEDEEERLQTIHEAGELLLKAAELAREPTEAIADRIIQDFYNPLVASGQKREMGASLALARRGAELLEEAGRKLLGLEGGSLEHHHHHH
uniref:Claudin-4 n=1 Tax=Homo sapiens TaxID=9606 RepID=UPI0031384A34